MSRWVILLVEAVSDFTITAGAVLTGYMTANGAVVMPSRAALILTFVAGCVGAANQVRGRLKELPVAKLLVLVGLLGLAGCAGPLGNNMSADQLAPWVKNKDATCSKITGVYMGATFNAVSVSVDKGIPPGAGAVTIDGDCKVTVTSDGKK